MDDSLLKSPYRGILEKKMIAWILVIILVVAAIIVRLKRSSHFIFVKRQHLGFRKNHSRQNKTDDGETMVRCEHCGIYIPASEAVRHGGKAYCSKEHSLKASF